MMGMNRICRQGILGEFDSCIDICPFCLQYDVLCTAAIYYNDFYNK